jgi:HSP20 family protein
MPYTSHLKNLRICEMVIKPVSMLSMFYAATLCAALVATPATASIAFSSGFLPSVIDDLRGFSGFEDPARGLDVLTRSMRDLSDFADFLVNPSAESRERRNTGLRETKKSDGTIHRELRLRPRFEIQESKDGLVILGTTPGLRKEDLVVEVIEGPDGKVLEISGQSPNATASREPSPPRANIDAGIERKIPQLRAGYGKFERRVKIPDYIDASTLSAKYNDGLLVLTMMPVVKKEETQRQKIAIH